MVQERKARTIKFEILVYEGVESTSNLNEVLKEGRNKEKTERGGKGKILDDERGF